MFYSDGLNFTCQMCSYCCANEPGYVFLSEKDIDNLATFLAVDRDIFIKNYTRYVDYGRYYLISLKERTNYDCEFLTKNGCSVYSARPVQCRTYPFWENILSSRSNWDNESIYCKGINKGHKVSKLDIEKALKANSDNAPLIILKNKMGNSLKK